MSRCFPFPPPGYEKKLRTEPVNLLKKEKHKSKKDKKDREKKEGKERKHKDKNKEKHGENVKQERDREKKKDKDREKKKDKEREKKDKDKCRDKAGPSNEKTPEQPAGSRDEPTFVEARQKAEDNDDDNNNNNNKFVKELHQRMQNEVAGDRMVENVSRIPKSDGKLDNTVLQKRTHNEMVQNSIRPDGTILQKRAYNEMVQNPARFDGTMLQKRLHNEMLQNSVSIQKKNGDTSIMPEGKLTGHTLDHNGGMELDVRAHIEGQDTNKKIEKKNKAPDQVNTRKIENDANKRSEKKDKTSDQVNVEKIGKDKDKEKKKDRKDKEKSKEGKIRDREKNKDGKDRHRNKEKKKEKDKVKDKKQKNNKHNADVTTGLHTSNTDKKQLPNNIVPPHYTEKEHQSDGDLKKKVINGFVHEPRPNKLAKVVPSSLLPLENGRKLDLQHIGLRNNSEKQATPNSIKLLSPDSKDQKLNDGSVQHLTPTVPSNAVARPVAETDEVTQKPAQLGPSRVSSTAAIHEGHQRPLQSPTPIVSLQSAPPRVSSNSVVTGAAEISEGSQRPTKSLPPRAALNAVTRVAAGANEDPQRPPPQAPPTKMSRNTIVRDAGEIGESSPRPPHPDEKYLAVVLHVPEMDEWPETDDQEWLFRNGDLLQKKRKLKVEANEEPQVWAKAQRIESSDVLALPYVIPY